MIPLFEVATLFVDMCQAVTDESIIGRAQRAGKIQVRYWNIRDYAGNKHNRVDDCTYGGGRGMLMQAAPIYRCWQAVCQASGERPYVVFPSPQGKVFTQQKAVELSRRPRLLFLCGHYEGVDQRVLDQIVDEELSLGDFVLTGGSFPPWRCWTRWLVSAPAFSARRAALPKRAFTTVCWNIPSTATRRYGTAGRCPRCFSLATTPTSPNGAGSSPCW